MRDDNRRSHRIALARRAWVDPADGSQVIECLIKNISDSGGMLLFGSPKKVPDRFVLRLSEDGRVARKCRVIWNLEHTMGVEFYEFV